MAGGLGRAQSGYDEMVFRSMVKDGAPLYDPLGLVSEGTKVDFQLQINSYLYGTRFMVWLARSYGPRRSSSGSGAREGSRAYYAAQFRPCSARRWRRRGPTGSPTRRAFQQKNLAAIRKYPVTPARGSDDPRARLGVTRVLRRRRRRRSTPRQLPGRRVACRRDRTATGAVTRLVNIKGPTMYHGHVARARSRARHALLHHRQRRVARPGRARPVTSRSHAAAEGRADRRPRVRSRRSASLWGIRQLDGLDTLVRIPAPYTDVEAGAHLPVRHRRLRPRRLARRHAARGVVRRDHAASRACGCSRSTALTRGDLTPVAEFDFGTAVPNDFVFSPTAVTCTAARTTQASRTSSATRSRPGARGGDATPTPVSSGRFRSATTS